MASINKFTSKKPARRGASSAGTRVRRDGPCPINDHHQVETDARAGHRASLIEPETTTAVVSHILTPEAHGKEIRKWDESHRHPDNKERSVAETAAGTGSGFHSDKTTYQKTDSQSLKGVRGSVVSINMVEVYPDINLLEQWVPSPFSEMDFKLGGFGAIFDGDRQDIPETIDGADLVEMTPTNKGYRA